MAPEARWRHVAQYFLDRAVNPPTEEWRRTEWEKTRNAQAERYSAMLGVPNPVTAALADALGLGDAPAESAPVTVSMDAFGL